MSYDCLQAPSSIFRLQALALIWSLLSSLCILNAWETNDHEALAIAIIVFSGVNLCTNCIKVLSAVRLDLPLAQLRTVKHLYIAGADVAFDIVIALAIYIGTDDVTSETALITAGTLIGLFHEISECLLEGCFWKLDDATNTFAGPDSHGFWIVAVPSTFQLAAALCQGGILIGLASKVEGGDMFIGITVGTLVEIGLLSGCALCLRKIMCQAFRDGGVVHVQKSDAVRGVNVRAAGGHDIEMQEKDGVDAMHVIAR